MSAQSILETLKKAKRPTMFLLNIFIGGHNYREMKRKAFYPTLPEFSKQKDAAQLSKEKEHNFYSALYQLKKQGLIKKELRKNKTYWEITSLGKNKIEKIGKIFHLPTPIYKREKDNGVNIVVFDIPEKRKNMRSWLRSALLNMGFTLLQKSVWTGKNKLPENFLKDLSDLGLMDCVHIFRAVKLGTITAKKN